MYRLFLKSSPAFRVILAMVITIGWLHSAPYGPNGMEIEWTQPDGTTFSLRVFGDEFYGRTETIDGYTVTFDPSTKSYYYANTSADGQELLATGMALGLGNPQALGLAKHLDIQPAARTAKALARVQEWDEATENSQRWSELKAQRQAYDEALQQPKPADGPQFSPPSFTTIGDKVGLTLLIDFSDAPGTIPQAEVISYCNGDNYTGYGNNGSVKEYFQDNSNNLLNYTNTVTAYIRMAQPKSYYNNTAAQTGTQGRLLLNDAIDILKTLPNYNSEILPTFDTLTVDGSNRVLACNVFFAGGTSGAWSRGLWPHASNLASPKELSAGGKRVFKYQITNLGTSLTLGTFCHENGHMLCGYPDVYDYSGDSKGGAGIFCLMSGGGGSTNPVLISAYLKRTSGWTTTTELTNSSYLAGTLTSTVGHPDYNKIYRYAKPGSSTEYYLFENRQKSGRDANIAASGIAIWHVDELGDHNNQSLVPNTTNDNYEVSLIQADNLWQFQSNTNGGDSKDLYYLGNTAEAYTNTFNDTSSPDAKWWSGASSGLSAYNFSASGTTMTLQFGFPANTIAITSPNGGELLYFSSTREIKWLYNTSGNVAIELYKGGSLHTVLSANETNDGSYSWVLSPALPSGTDYTIKISSVNNPAYTDFSDATFSIIGQPTIADALDTPGMAWNTPGISKWFTQSITTHDGIDAAQSGPIGHGQFINMDTTVTGPGTLTFWWKVSSQPTFDVLGFYLDGTEQTGSLAKISGLVDWVQKTVAIPSGNHTVQWRYSKNSSVSTNADAAYLDQVVYTPSVPEIAVEDPANSNLIDGTASIDCGVFNLSSSSLPLTITVKNNGNLDLTGLSLTKDGSHSADFTLGSLGATTLAPGASTTFTATFAPGAEGARTAAVHIASNDADENPFDINLTGTGVTVGTLVVTPPGSFTSSGSYSGSFTPNSKQYTLSNPGTTSLDWTATKTAAWVDLSTTSGALAAGASTTVTVSINNTADALTIYNYSDTVMFINTTNGNGNTTRGVSLTVNPIPAIVTIGNLSQPYNGSPIAVSVTTSPPGLEYAITYDGVSNPPTNSGTYAVVATITTPNYSGSDSQNLEITKTTQTINFAALNPVPDDQGSLALTATATSGLTVSYASSNPAVATISGSTATIIGLGTSSITASQGGNINYTAATLVQQTLTVLDLTSPAIASLSPADNTTNAPSNANLVVTFNETVALGTGNIIIKNLTDGNQSTIAITDTTQVSRAGSVLTINPTADLLVGKNYAIRLASTAITDSATNAFPGISDDTTWNFTIVTPPTASFWLGITGNWSAPATWVDGVTTTGIDFTTSLTGIDITANRTITLDTARTVGNITFTDTTPSHDATISGANTLTLDRTTGVPTIEVTQAGRALTISSVIAGNDGLQKNGSGTLTLTGPNTYTGNTNINSGTLRLEGGSGGFFSNTNATRTYTISSGATLNLHGASVPVGTANITGSGTLLLTGGGVSAGNSGRAVNMNLTAGAVIDIQSGSSLYNGGWQAFTWTNNNAILNVNGGLDIVDGNAVTADALTGNGTITSATNGGSAINFTLGVNNGSGTFTGNITAAGTRAVSLVKNGSGSQALAGTSTFRGATTVSAGTLAITGSLSTTGVTVINSATLGGNGNIGGNVTIASGARHALAVAATPAAQVTRAITGTLTLTSGNILDLTSASTPAAGVYVLATATTAITGTPTTINYNGITGAVSVDTASAPKRLLLTVTGSTYASWIAGYPGAASLPGFDQDADGDGVKNGVENFFGTNPAGFTAGLLPGTKTANTFTFTHPQNASPASNVSATYRWSKNLATFQEAGTSEGTTVSFNAVTSAGITTVTATVTGTATEKLFVDVKVLQN